MMNIKKIVIKNFRSIGDDGIELVSPNKINLLIGKNNCGKTNILRFVSLLGTSGFCNTLSSINLNSALNINVLNLSVDDYRDFSDREPIKFSLYIEPSAAFATRTFGLIPLDNFYVTYSFEKNGTTGNNYVCKVVDSFIDHLPESIIRAFEAKNASTHGGTSGGDFHQAKERVKAVLGIFQQFSFPKVEYMNEFRKLTQDRSLREKLNEIVNPSYTNQKNLIKKKLLCSYFKSVFGFDVDIKIPNIEKEIELVIDEKQIPLSSLGAGLQQVVLIALTIVTTEADVICIDEPELHIHPGAQRELLNLMSTVDDKSFFLATHSNHFLDYEVDNKKIYQLVNVDNRTKVTVSVGYDDVAKILDDLGIRASEIYQANGIIWVEGPSDRIYIKKWIELLAPELKEGLQFTFQYYGGKILSHFSLTDFEYKEYLNLLNINKNAYIVMDSDMKAEYSLEELRDTKKRIIEECEKSNIGCWVTKGREVENYLSSRTLSEHSGSVIAGDIFATIGEYCPSFNKDKKVQFAREVAEIITLVDIEGNTDLEVNVREVVAKIKGWNQ